MKIIFSVSRSKCWTSLHVPRLDFYLGASKWRFWIERYYSNIRKSLFRVANKIKNVDNGVYIQCCSWLYNLVYITAEKSTIRYIIYVFKVKCTILFLLYFHLLSFHKKILNLKQYSKCRYNCWLICIGQVIKEEDKLWDLVITANPT